MEKSIESIWKEGFLKNDALIAPRINNLYNQKSQHIVEKFKRMYEINIKAVFLFAFIILPFTFLTNIPYMGIPMFFVFMTMVIYSSKFKKKLDNIDTSENSYHYLHSFNKWVKEMVAFNTKISRFLYPVVFLAMASGFWFGSIGGDIPGDEFIQMLQIEFPNMLMIFGVPFVLIICFFCILALLAYFGGKIGQWDLNLVYGGILIKLKRLLEEMEELRA